MHKALGIIIVFFSCVIFSFIKGEELKTKINNLREIKKALFLIKNELSFSNKELSYALSEVSKNVSGDVSKFFGYISDELTKDKGKSFRQAYIDAKENINKDCFLSKEAERIVDAFSTSVGKMSREAEIENIDKAIVDLEQVLTCENENFLKTKKLIYSAGVGIGSAVVILFI
ncbi:MAG: stage III sporulation protein AB [Clostridia bacterium]|nr:stage III sporulation protein AB [Clostridia bacterium]